MPSPPLTAAPRLTIVIPSLNQARFLETAIRSVLDQDASTELIVMDGGSSDGSIEIIRKYHDRIASWSSHRDAGVAAALQAGFGRATGDVFGFLNADDFYLPGCLKTISEWFAAHPTADVVSGHGHFVSADGVPGPEVRSDRWNLTRFSHGACVLLQPGTFFRRRAFERTRGFRQQSGLCWDMQLWADLAETGADFHTISVRLAAFRLHGASITGHPGNRQQRIDDAKSVRKKVLGHAGSVSRAKEWAYRLEKFASHPLLTLRQRLYFRRVLHRWSI